MPKLPLSALTFYLTIFALYKLGYIPSPSEILAFLEGLYQTYGLTGLFMATFLESIVYLGLYFPGSFIVALAVILSDGSFQSLLTISLVVASALTATASINYFFGRKISKTKIFTELAKESKKVFSKGLIASMLHPNSLAFYFFNSGIRKHRFKQILFVPVIMIPYGLGLGYFFYSIKDPLKTALENPLLVVSVLAVWLVIAMLSGKLSKTD